MKITIVSCIFVDANDAIHYVPDPAFCGQDSFAYTIEDGRRGADSALVTVEIVCDEGAGVFAGPLAGRSTDEDSPSSDPMDTAAALVAACERDVDMLGELLEAYMDE